MNICKKCGRSFKTQIKIDGSYKGMKNRRYCLICSPYKSHNTRRLELSKTEKFCKRCGKIKPISDFYFKKDKVHSYSYCKLCYHHQCVDYLIATKEQSVKYKGGQCLLCGYKKYSGALEFHHLDPKKKDRSIKLRNRSFENIKKELDKCVLLCSNCHKEVHGKVATLEGLEPS